jgi:outer membrane receptor protein involved in Fe transport
LTASEANDFNRYPFDPKLARGYEGGLRFTALNEKLGGSVSYFYNDNTNLPRNDPNRSNELTVSGRELGQGTEVILYYYPIKGATIYLNYVNLNSEILSNIQAPWLEGGIAGDGGAVSQLFAIRVPGFVTLDVNAWYPMSRGRKMDVGLMAGVRNLTDKFYMQGAMMVAQGRSFWAGISSKY